MRQATPANRMRALRRRSQPKWLLPYWAACARPRRTNPSQPGRQAGRATPRLANPSRPVRQARTHRLLFDHGGLSALSQFMALELPLFINGRTGKAPAPPLRSAPERRTCGDAQKVGATDHGSRRRDGRERRWLRRYQQQFIEQQQHHKRRSQRWHGLHLRRVRRDVELPVQPVQRLGGVRLVRTGVRRARLRGLAEERGHHAVAVHRVGVVQQRQDPDVHHP